MTMVYSLRPTKNRRIELADERADDAEPNGRHTPDGCLSFLKPRLKISHDFFTAECRRRSRQEDYGLLVRRLRSQLRPLLCVRTSAAALRTGECFIRKAKA